MDNQLPLVTIGAINYNNAKYVIQTLESIKAQTYPNIELIIVDDCSTDNSVTLISNWLQAYDKPHKFIRHEKNAGVCATCNSALKRAKGQYFNLIATDDIMMPDKIKVQVEMLAKSAADVCGVYSDAYLIKEDGSPRYGWFIQRVKDFDTLPSGNIYETLFRGNFLPAMSLLIKMDCYRDVGFFDESLKSEDYDMWLRLAKKYKFLLSDYVSVKYRIRQGSLMSVINRWNPTLIRIFSKHLNHHPAALTAIEELALNSYCTQDRESLKIIQGLADKSLSLKTINYLWKFKVPTPIGVRIIFKLRKV